MCLLENYSNIPVAEANRIIHDKLAFGKRTAKLLNSVIRFHSRFFWTLLIKQATAFKKVHWMLHFPTADSPFLWKRYCWCAPDFHTFYHIFLDQRSRRRIYSTLQYILHQKCFRSLQFRSFLAIGMLVRLCVLTVVWWLFPEWRHKFINTSLGCVNRIVYTAYLIYKCILI